MKRTLPFLMALCLLLAAVPAVWASDGLGATFEGEREETREETFSGATEEGEGAREAPDGPGEEQEDAREDAGESGEALAPERGAGQPAGFPVTAQQWIQGFHIAAGAQDLALGGGFYYWPGLSTGQHLYELSLVETPEHMIMVQVASDDGVAISSCAMRMASAALGPDELTRANDTLWRAARAMIAASEPEAKQEDIEELCAALCPDLPAALIRGERVESIHWLGRISCSLWAGFVEEAFFGDSPGPVDGYIVDFLIQADAPEEPG